MSRGRKLTKAEKRRRRLLAGKTTRRRETTEGILDDLVCSHATAVNAAGLCDARLADLEVDLTLAHLAAALWRGREGKAQSLGSALVDLSVECQRHRDALVEILDRLDPLASDEFLHDHLDPAAVTPEKLRALRDEIQPGH